MYRIQVYLLRLGFLLRLFVSLTLRLFVLERSNIRLFVSLTLRLFVSNRGSAGLVAHLLQGFLAEGIEVDSVGDI
ncbi:MAG: hypothetical protein ACI3YC_05130, partial [Alloprevotella sp.]